MISPSKDIKIIIDVMKFIDYHIDELSDGSVCITGELKSAGSYSTINKRAEQLKEYRLAMIRMNNQYIFIKRE